MSRLPGRVSPPPAAAVGLSVDRLTVDGVGESDARRLGASLERRLGALIAERGLPASLARAQDGPTGDGLVLPDLDLDLDLRLDRTPPERAGARLAEALWSRLDRPIGRARADRHREPES